MFSKEGKVCVSVREARFSCSNKQSETSLTSTVDVYFSFTLHIRAAVFHVCLPSKIQTLATASI